MSVSSNFIGFNTIVTKEVHRFFRIWVQTLLPSAITMTLYFLIFGSLIGKRIGTMNGISYVQFIAPGLIMMAVITNSYANVAGSFFGAKFSRCVEEMLVSPTPNYLILLGYISGGVARGLAVGLVVTVVALFFTHLHVQHIAVTLGVVLMSSILFSLAGFINALYARNFEDVSIIPTFVLTPLTYLGGVFYSVSLLPSFWYKVSLANPVLYIVDAFRYGILGASDINVVDAMLVICIFVVILFSASLYLLNKGVGIRT